MFTAEQQAALSLDHHSIVSAAAGSGKTRVLVERYVRMLREGADPRSIVAITFTRKAAAEMLARVARSIDAYLADPETPETELLLLRRAKLRLSSARISTIHAFCSSLLREFPIEAGISPDFRELGTGEAQRLRDAAAQHVFEQHLESKELALSLRELILEMGLSTVQTLVKDLARSPEDVFALQRFYESNSDQDILSRAGSVVASALVEQVSLILEALLALQSLMSPAALTAMPKSSTNIAAVQQLLMQVQQGRSDAALLDELERTSLAACKYVMAERSFAEPLKKIAKDLSANHSTFILKAAAQMAELHETYGQTQLNERSIDFARRVTKLAVEVLAEMSAEKAELGAYDFDDLQLLARDLLRNSESVRERVRRDVPFLMIDEFQDTNALQYEIACLIVECMKDEHNLQTRPNLFIVGDAKQSIYGFRRADVRVFEEARRDIVAANRRAMGLSAEADDEAEHDDSGATHSRPGEIFLSTSFRMTAPLVAFVNRISGTLMSQRQSEYDVRYEQMISGRSEKTCADAHVEIIVGQRPRRLTTKNKDEVSRAVQSEEELVAIRLQNILSDATLQVWDDDLHALRAIEPRDIAILARKGSRLGALLHELRLRDIPAIRSGGRGFYDTQEVQDLLAVLHILGNPADDANLAAVLRSPYFAVHDAILYRLCRKRVRNASLWEHLCASAEHIEDNHLQRALTILSELFAQRSSATASQLLHAFLRDTGWFGAIEYSERAGQSRANIQKCLELVGSLESHGFRHLHDVREELERLAQAEDNESEAAIIGDENAVHLMTVHASKGLEFPLVVVYDMNYRSQKSSSMYINEQYGLSFGLPDSSGKKANSSLLGLSKLLDRAKDHAEDKRLLYVALTRARDHLIMSMVVDYIESQTLFDEQKSDGFMKLLQEGLHLPFSLQQNGSAQLSMSQDVLRDGQVQQSEVQCELRISVEAEQHSMLSMSSEKGETAVQRPVLIPLRQFLHGDENYSASHAMTYAADPLEYFRIYHLGLASSDEQRFQSRRMKVEDEVDRVTSTLGGIIIHAALARQREWCNDAAEVDSTALEQCLDQVLFEHELPKDHELRNRVRQDLLRVCAMSSVRENMPALRQAHHEYSFTMPLGDDFLNGTMDLLLRNSADEVEVWDWKTNRLDKRSEDDWLHHYALQLKVYCLLLSFEYPEQQIFRARLLFTRKGTERSIVMSREALHDFVNELESMFLAMKKSLPSVEG